MGVILERKKRILLNEPHIVTTTPAGVANFSTDLIAPLKSCKVEFSPVQSGSGDPSPENVRPISGWTGVNVYRAGKNLIDKTKYVSYANSKRFIAYGVNNWSDVTPNGDLALGIGSYTISLSGDNTVYPDSISVYNSAWERIKIVYHNKIVNFSVTLPGAHAIYINFADKVPFDSYDVQLEPGSTATAYEPYTGSTTPLDWTTEAGTVYGGYVDLVKGQLVAEYALYTFTGTEGFAVVHSPSNVEQFGYFRLYSNTFTNIITNWDSNNDCLISCYRVKNQLSYWYSGGLNDDAVAWNVKGYAGICIRDDRYDLTSFKAFIAGKTMSYKLATPITYQLTPTQLKSLRGVNNIWSDANGDTTVKYWTH